MAALSNRLKAAALGFGITVAPLAIVATAHLTFMSQIVAAMEGWGSSDRALTISTQRREWFATHSIVAVMFAIYWVITAACGRGQLLRHKVANIILAFCVAAYLTITFRYIFFQRHDLIILCPLFGISDTDVSPYAIDFATSCQQFANAADLFIVLGLVGLIVPLVISLVVRIVSSRRENQLEDNAPPSLLE